MPPARGSTPAPCPNQYGYGYKNMTTVAIVPIADTNGERAYRAIAGDKQSTGKTAGAALDALTAQLESDECSTLWIIQSFRPDGFFSATQRQRLAELMALWRTDRGEALSPALQTELDQLVEAELKAATARSTALVQQLSE